MKIGIMGGSFDPPHMGHMVFAEQALVQLGLDRVYLVPCAHSPHMYKDIRTPAEHRLNMLKIAASGNDRFVVSDIEINKGGMSYTIDTVEYFLSSHAADDITLLIGEDLYQGFSSWKNYKEILKKVRVTVILRGKSAEQAELVPEFSSMTMPELTISSTFIREQINSGMPVKYYVDAGVEEYIAKHKLYQGEQRG